jgi:hypothetical protein
MPIENINSITSKNEDARQAHRDTLRRMNAFHDILVGDKITIKASPYKPTAQSKIVNNPTVVAIYPTYLLLNNGRYNFCASKDELFNNEAVVF